MFRSHTPVSTLAFVFCAVFCSLLGSQVCRAADTIKPVYTAEETKSFKELAQATIDAIDGHNEKVMVAKITDLETAWDAKEEVLKPKDPATWTLIDKTLDKGISAIRSSNVDLKKGKEALKDLIKKLDAATKK